MYQKKILTKQKRQSSIRLSFFDKHIVDHTLLYSISCKIGLPIMIFYKVF